MLLSRAGKEVLIKTVAQSITTYTMSVFQLLIKLCDELDAICARFWWGQVGNEWKIHWKSWDKLSISKKEGGMEFRDFRAFNLAMLAKQGQRMLQEDDSLLYKCYKARYFKCSTFLKAVESPNCSFIWRSIIAALPILKTSCCWRVGNDSSIRVRWDRWIPNHPTHKILYPTNEETEDLLVSDFIDPDLHWWMKRKEFRGDGFIWMDLTDQDKWVKGKQIQCERTRVDGSKGHVALSWSLYGLKEILNGNNLRLTINPSP